MVEPDLASCFIRCFGFAFSRACIQVPITAAALPVSQLPSRPRAEDLLPASRWAARKLDTYALVEAAATPVNGYLQHDRGRPSVHSNLGRVVRFASTVLPMTSAAAARRHPRMDPEADVLELEMDVQPIQFYLLPASLVLWHGTDVVFPAMDARVTMPPYETRSCLLCAGPVRLVHARLSAPVSSPKFLAVCGHRVIVAAITPGEAGATPEQGNIAAT